MLQEHLSVIGDGYFQHGQFTTLYLDKNGRLDISQKVAVRHFNQLPTSACDSDVEPRLCNP